MWTKPRSRVGPILRRLFACALVAALILSLRLVWGWQASRRLTAANATLSAMHIRTRTSEFQTPGKIPAEQDAYNDLAAISGTLNDGDPMSGEMSPAQLLVHRSCTPAGFSKLSPAERLRLAEVLNNYDRTIVGLDAIDGKIAHWPVLEGPYSRPDFNYLGMDNLNRILLADSLLAIYLHDSRRALVSCRRMLVACEILNQDTEGILSWPTGIALDETCDLLEQISPLIAASGDQATLLARIIALLNASELEPPLVEGFEFEFALRLEQRPSSSPWLLQPLSDKGLAVAIERQACWLQILRARTRTDLFALEQPAYVPIDNLQELTRDFSDRPSFDAIGASVYLFNIEVKSRSIAAMLAAHLSAARHGTFPQRLADLVPEFLPAIPTDPWADGAPIHYRLDPDGPTLWSVGRDGLDNGGHVYPTTEGDTRSNDLVVGAENRRARASAVIK